jgi:hypothetical protein
VSFERLAKRLASKLVAEIGVRFSNGSILIAVFAH